jgi:hypothetical protein
LKKEEREKYQKQTYQQLNEIIDRNLGILQENAEKDGVGAFMDTMSVKRKCTGSPTTIEKVQAELDAIRAQEGRRKVQHLPEALLQLALDVQNRMPEGETIETLAKTLKIDLAALKAFLSGDKEKTIRMKKHKGTATTLRKWLKKQPANQKEEPPPSKRARVDPSEPVDNDDIKNIQAQMAKLRKQTGRRKSAAMHMTEELLELAIQVHRYMLKMKLSLEAVVTELDDEEISEFPLSRFLAGDENRIIRLASHQAMAKALTEWMARSTEEAEKESEEESEEEVVEMEAETAIPVEAADAEEEAEVSSPEVRTGSLHSVL